MKDIILSILEWLVMPIAIVVVAGSVWAIIESYWRQYLKPLPFDTVILLAWAIFTAIALGIYSWKVYEYNEHHHQAGCTGSTRTDR